MRLVSSLLSTLFVGMMLKSRAMVKSPVRPVAAPPLWDAHDSDDFLSVPEDAVVAPTMSMDDISRLHDKLMISLDEENAGEFFEVAWAFYQNGQTRVDSARAFVTLDARGQHFNDVRVQVLRSIVCADLVLGMTDRVSGSQNSALYKKIGVYGTTADGTVPLFAGVNDTRFKDALARSDALEDLHFEATERIVDLESLAKSHHLGSLKPFVELALRRLKGH